jgi:hypothetical protein
VAVRTESGPEPVSPYARRARKTMSRITRIRTTVPIPIYMTEPIPVMARKVTFVIPGNVGGRGTKRACAG